MFCLSQYFINKKPRLFKTGVSFLLFIKEGDVKFIGNVLTETTLNKNKPEKMIFKTKSKKI
jgi:hypothetical protein